MAPSKHVKVVVRTRPTSDFATENIKIHPDSKSVTLYAKKQSDVPGSGYINNQQDHWDFKFDAILHNASQETVFEECASPIVNSLFDGYNGTILAYGQTGAGKTFTMTGATENFRHRGLVPRAISQVFRGISERPQSAVIVRVSYLEIYNEIMNDLLAPSDENQDMTIIDERNGSVVVKGLSSFVANSEEEALNFLFEGETNRAVADHQLNRTSSRLESRSRVESSEKVVYSKLNLVDLAGSERLSKTQSSGTVLKEAMFINKSLTFLEQVILALSDKKRDHVPYRQSKLTNVLRDALGGNCNTIMIANVWGERQHLEETISTLRFATRMMCVTTTPVVNIQYDPMALIKKYEKEIKELKQELAMHDTLSNRSHVRYEPFTEAQKADLYRQAKHFLESEDEEIEIVNLRQIKELLNQFRIIFKSLSSEAEVFSRQKNQSSTNIGGLVSVDIRDEKTEQVNNEVKHDDFLMDDSGVGDSDGLGFGVGLAPQGRKNVSSKSTKRPSIPVQKNPAVPLKTPPVQGKTQPTTPETFEDNASEMKEEEKAIAIAENFLLSHATRTNSTTQLPPLSTTASRIIQQQHQQSPHLGKAPSRADEFENFKRSKGSEVNRILNENKALLKEKRKQSKQLAETANDIKIKIDKLKAEIAKKQSLHPQKDESASNIIIDEEEYNMLSEIRFLKSEYRENFESLKKLKSDIDYCTRLVDQCRQKLMSEFESWYEQLYGFANSAGVENNDGKLTFAEDLMDVGEKFDKLQLERMSQEDPDSYAYYIAKKNQERRMQRELVKTRRFSKDQVTSPVNQRRSIKNI